jgi:thiaminase/transcriptional activator TenA
MKFTEQIRLASKDSWEASFRHPFVLGIADGTLPLDCFRYYILNDSYYLSVFAQVQGLGAAKAHDLHTSGRMAAHIQGTYTTELAMHEKFSRLLNITPEEKQSFIPSPTAYAYTSHLLRAAYTGHIGDIVAVMLPCYWLYLEIGDRLKGAEPEEPIYREWIGTYGSDRFRETVQEQIDRLDTIAEQVHPNERARMNQHFVISSKYEYHFWEMAYRQEKWSV